MCTNIELRVVETPEPESGSTYRVQLPGTDAECEFMFHPDLAERQELRYIMQGISRGDVGEEFVRRLKDYGTKLYKLLFGGAVGEEFRRLSQTGFRLWLHLPPGSRSATMGVPCIRRRIYIQRQSELPYSDTVHGKGRSIVTKDFTTATASCNYIRPARPPRGEEA